MNFVVIKIKARDTEFFHESLRRDYDGIADWGTGVFSFEVDSAKEIMEIKEKYKKDSRVTIFTAATAARILNYLETIS